MRVQDSHGRSLGGSMGKPSGEGEERPSREDWKRILSGGMIARFKPGESLITEGAAADCLFQVIDGRCAVKRRVQKKNLGSVCGQAPRLFSSTPSIGLGGDSDKGEEEESDDVFLTSNAVTVELGTLGVDQVVGEVSLLMGTPPTASVVATASTEVYMISSFFLRFLFTSDPLLGWRFFNYLAAAVDERILQHCLAPVTRRNSAPRLSSSTEDAAVE